MLQHMPRFVIALRANAGCTNKSRIKFQDK